jgi:hypothetical protein
MPCDVCPCPGAGYAFCPWEAGTHRHPNTIVCSRIRNGDEAWRLETLRQAEKDSPLKPGAVTPSGAVTQDDRLVEADVFPATTIPARPVFFSHDMRTIDLTDFYRDRPAFLCGRGPSLEQMDLTFLNKPGVLSLALNGACELLRPTLWLVNDPPDRFTQPYWNDPGVIKLIPREHRDVMIADGKDVKAHAATLFFARNARFRADRFLIEPTFNIGCDVGVDDGLGHASGRSVMLPAIKILYVLGVRRVYLLGCDFKMNPEKPYAGSDIKSERACKTNNNKFQIINARLEVLWRPFHDAGFEILNCTPGSELTAFPTIPYDEAVLEYQSVTED